MIDRGVLSLEKIDNDKVTEERRGGRKVILLERRIGNGAVQEKIVDPSGGNNNGRAEEMTYVFGNGIVLRFEKFLPEDWKLTKALAKFSCDLKEKSVSYGNMGEKFSIPALLHEIGHCLSLEKLREEQPEKYEKWMEYMHLEEEDKDPIVYGDIEEIIRMLAVEERNAWAFVVKIRRILKNNGLVIGGDVNLEELEEEIQNCLGTYEGRFGHRVGGKIFTKKKKRQLG